MHPHHVVKHKRRLRCADPRSDAFRSAHFSDRGHSFQADRGQRFSVIADGREVHEWLRASYLSCPASA
jgi:hypothetical protein